MRFGFAVKVLGIPGMKTNDTRRWQSSPSLGVSLEYLDAVFDYLAKHSISMYRMSSDIAPYATHPDLPQFHSQPKEFAKQLRAAGDKAQRLDIRLSFHPSQFIVLNSPDEAVRHKSMWDLKVQAEILDRMALGRDAVMVIHVGGAYGDSASGIERWVRTWEKLPHEVRDRLVLENDDIRYSASDVLRIHEQTGVRLVFDIQHFHCLNPEALEVRPTVEKFLKTWPAGTTPKIHFSSPRTEMREISRVDRKTGKKKTVLQAPVWTGHAAYNNPFEFINLMRTLDGLNFDVMLEAKAKDLALLRLRQDLVRYAPDVAARFGLGATTEAAPEEIELAPEALASAAG